MRERESLSRNTRNKVNKPINESNDSQRARADDIITQDETNKVTEAEKIIKAQHESVRSIMEKLKPTNQIQYL